MQTIQQARDSYDAARTELYRAASAVEALPATTSPEDLQRAEQALERASRAADDGRRELNVCEARADAGVSFDRVSVTGEPATYQRGGPHGFFADAVAATSGDLDAAERLRRNQREVADARGRDSYSLDTTLPINGGALVMPTYLGDAFAAIARGGRPAATAIGIRPLPAGTDSLVIPTMATGTTTAAQGNENTAVSNTDATFATVTADVQTIAGMQDVSQQLVDRAVPGIDEIIFRDLAADYVALHERQVINGTVANCLGLLQVSGTNAVTYTDTGPTVGELMPKVADAAQRISSSAIVPPSVIVCHPRRWGWMLAATDTTGRPLVSPAPAHGPANALAVAGPVAAEGVVGQLAGLPVVTSASIPTNLGGGTEDAIIIAAGPECYIWEAPDGPFLETFRDVGSASLTVRFRLHNYVAQAFGRRPLAISKINGTGLAAPTW